jgi:hypothetical protein
MEPGHPAGGRRRGIRSTAIGPGETFATAVRGSNGSRVGIPMDVNGVSMNVSIVNPTS